MEDPPDWAALVDAAQTGDRAAQAELLRRFEPLARSTACRLIDQEHVDDVVQESFAVALRALPRLRVPAAFPSWLRLIVRKEASRARVHRDEVALDAVDEPHVPGADPADHAERREVAALVRLALESAPDQDRRLLELRHLAGWATGDLADLLGISPGAVRKRLHDARRRLRPHLDHLDSKEQTVTDHRRYLDAVHPADLDIPSSPSLRPPDAGPTVTGLKVVDAMAPVRRGGTIEMVGPAGTGHVVIALELLYRLGRTEHEVACVGVGRAGAAIGSQPDLAHLVTEPGIPGPNAVVLATEPDETAQAFAAGSSLAAGLAAEGLDVVLVVDRPSLDQVDPAALRASAGLAREGSVTVVALHTTGRSAAVESTMGLDTTLVFSLEHLALGIFPAIDGARSSSIFEVSAPARQARERLDDAATLRSWFHQPLHVARAHTGEDGTWIDPDATATELAALLS